MVTNWSIVSIWESIAGWIMGYDNKGYILHSTASVPHTISRTAIGQVSKHDPGEEHVSPRGKTGGT